MNSIVERLRTVLLNLHEQNEAADLIEQQAERIKELEAERDAERDNCVAIIAAYQEQLATLRQRIADAPVVAWVIRNAECDMKGWIPAKAWADGEFQYPLISKEDLQK